MPPIHMPFFLEAAILSRMRSPVTSRSNWAKDKSTFRVSRPMLVVVLNCWVIDTNETPRRKATLMALFCRVEIRSDRVDITLSRGRLTQLLAGSLDLKMQYQAPPSAPDDLLGLTVPVGLKRVGREMRMLVENADDQTPADPSLLRIIARAHHMQARLIQNPKLTVHDIARDEQGSD